MKNSNFPDYLLQRLNNMRQQNQLCDVTINVESKTFHAHKSVLAGCSDYFLTMFSSGFKEKSASVVNIGGSAEAFGILLDFAYTGYLNTAQTHPNIFDVLELSCYAQFTELAETSSQFLMTLFQSEPDKIPLEDAWKISELSRQVDHLDDLLTASLIYFDDNVEGLKNLDIFLETASVTFLLEFLNRENLSDQDKEHQVCMRYCNNRKRYCNSRICKFPGPFKSSNMRTWYRIGIPECRRVIWSVNVLIIVASI